MEKKVKKSLLAGKNFLKNWRKYSVTLPHLWGKIKLSFSGHTAHEASHSSGLPHFYLPTRNGSDRGSLWGMRLGAPSTLAKERLPRHALSCLCLKCILGFRYSITLKLLLDSLVHCEYFSRKLYSVILTTDASYGQILVKMAISESNQLNAAQCAKWNPVVMRRLLLPHLWSICGRDSKIIDSYQ